MLVSTKQQWIMNAPQISCPQTALFVKYDYISFFVLCVGEKLCDTFRSFFLTQFDQSSLCPANTRSIDHV